MVFKLINLCFHIVFDNSFRRATRLVLTKTNPTGQLFGEKCTKSAPRDVITEPDNICTSEAEQLRPTVETASQNIIHTEAAIVMKSAEPTHQTINDDLIDSNKILFTLDRRSSLPVLIDSGASVSIFPSGLRQSGGTNLEKSHWNN